MKTGSKKRDLVSICDFNLDEIAELFQETQKLKSNRSKPTSKPLAGKTLAMIFQKPSTRTTVSFAVAASELGGYPLVLNTQDLQMKRGESIPDTARTLSLYVHGIMIRANRHDDVAELARHAKVPVINGLTDKEHPCQALGDLFTIFEKRNLKKVSELKQFKLVYLGDGNNVAHSLMLLAATIGMDMTVSSPKNYEPEKEFVQKSNELAKTTGAKITIVSDPTQAASGADVIYTDVWASMGKEEEREHRKQIFTPYQVNSPLLAFAKPDVQLMHCLPAHRGEEITDEVMDGPRSIVFEQAENRLHIQKSILQFLM